MMMMMDDDDADASNKRSMRWLKCTRCIRAQLFFAMAKETARYPQRALVSSSKGSGYWRQHSVEHSTQVKVKKRGSDKKFIAKVLAIGTECDLALLSVEDEKFFENVNAR